MPTYHKLKLKYPIEDVLNMKDNKLEKKLKYTLSKSQVVGEGNDYPPFEGWEIKYYIDNGSDAVVSKFLVLNGVIPKQPNTKYWYIREDGDRHDDWWFPIINVQDVSELFENPELLLEVANLITKLLISKARISYLKQELIPDAPPGYSKLATKRYGRPVDPERERKHQNYLRRTRFPKRDEDGVVFRESKIRKPRAKKLDELGELNILVEKILPNQINSIFKELVMVKKPEKPGKDDNFADQYYGYFENSFGSKINFDALNKKEMPQVKSSKKGGKGKGRGRGRQTKRAEVREADIRRMKKYGIPAALSAALTSGLYKAKPHIKRELKKYLKQPTKKVQVLLKNPDLVKSLYEQGNRDKAVVDAYNIINQNTSFGNVLAPAHRHPGNNIIAMNDPFSAIYTYDAPHTWGQMHDMATNLSGFPWYKGQEPTLAVAPRNSRSSFGAKRNGSNGRKVTKRKRKTTKRRKTVKKWVQKVIKNPGSLTAYAKRVAPRKAFTKLGTLKVAWLREVAKKDKSMKRRRQAQLALRLKKMPKRGKRKTVKRKRKTVRKVKRKTVKRKTVKRKRKVIKKKSLKSKKRSGTSTSRKRSGTSTSRKRNRKSKFGGKFNYTIQQYGNNATTPNLNQMHKISGVAAYDFPVAGPSAGGMNLRWFDSKTNQAGMGTW